MKEHKIRAIVWGCGQMGQIIIRYLQEKGVELVGAIDRNASRVGKDAGEISTLKRFLGIPIYHPDKAEQVFQKANANVCIICTRSLLTELYDSLEMAVQHGVNAITLGEEAFYPWTTSPDLSQKLDTLAKKHNCTITGSGYQDVFGGHLITSVAAASHRIDRIQFLIGFNIVQYGTFALDLAGVGLSVDTFKQTVATSKEPSLNWYINEWLCSRLGWSIRTQSQELLPTTNTEIIHVTGSGIDIPVGYVTGTDSVVTTETEEGPIIESHLMGKVYTHSDIDIYECTLIGEPNTTLTIRQPGTPEMICATLVNRLPQLITVR